MQIQTTTITTETAEVFGANFQVTTFEQTTTGFCDVCGDRQTGTADSLRAAGWYLGRNEHFCPNCND